MAKDFYKVSDLTDDLNRVITGSADGGNEYKMRVLMLRQMRIQLAIAQQLSVISGHLGELVEMCKNQSRKEL